ncbi:hypothetical protein BP5796_05596 [Coleophoma crateriformis]|uniref:AAA+ ATPase domain-containing protein n=1 Tax=Coleophoma crateriformis TaxID=565419 RepID=A0A3D8S3Q3_9HELO|nr:hypothetical protein BP5796_05596 [Coleophoma crateriformis]
MGSIRRSNRAATIAQTRKSEAVANAYSNAFAILDEDTHDDEGKKCEIHMYERRFNSRGEAILLQSGSRSEFSWITESSVEAALVLTRYYSITKALESTQLEVRSPYIRAALKDVVRSYPGVNVNSSGPILIPGDPKCLFHYRDELNTYASNTKDKKAKEHVKFLLQYMAKVLNREIVSYKELMENESVAPGLEFHNLWMAFKPGTLLYKSHSGVDTLHRLRDMTKVTLFQQPQYWRLQTEVLVYEGKDLRFVSENFDIAEYSGYRPLTEHELFPLEYHKDQKSIRDTVLQRGKKYTEYLGIQYCMYEGLANLFSWHGRGTQCSMIKDKIILDSKEFSEDIHDSKLEFIPYSKVIQCHSNGQLKMSDEELLICSYEVPGFALTTKRWGLFNISNVSPMEYNKDAFDSLVLPEDIKKTLTSLVRLQDANSPRFDDLIEGKGKGLIILLHGPPGVGKTFTAESIAEYAKRPLYTLGKVDFGPSMSQSLFTTLARASKWNSIVLLDEADVFMQERSPNEMFRNEQVSVLLRILEYFEGTMNLTTNQVQTIDPAFKSRIHLSLTYPALSAKSRSGLWKTFILKSTTPQSPRWLDAGFLKKISEEEVNGRDIKNIVHVAHALATNDKRPMRAKDILQGLTYLKDFERDFSKATADKRKVVEGEDASLAKRIRLDNRDCYNQEEQEEAQESVTKQRVEDNNHDNANGIA